MPLLPNWRALALISLLLPLAAYSAESTSLPHETNEPSVPTPIPITLSHLGLHELTARSAGDGTEEIETTGTDPFLYTLPLPKGTQLATTPILEFEYFSLTGVGQIQVFPSPPEQEGVSTIGPDLGPSQGWTSYRIDLTPSPDAPAERWRQLRIDFGREAGHSLQIRNIVIRPRNSEEVAAADRVEAIRVNDEEEDDALRAYLISDMHSYIENVTVHASTVKVSGYADWRDGDDRDGEFWLVEAPLEVDIPDTTSLAPLQRLTPGGPMFTDTVPRYAKDGRDRLYSRWAVVLKSEARTVFSSSARYATAVEARPGLTETKPRNRKGLGGYSPGRPVEDIKDLDISAVTVNITLDSFMRAKPGDGRTPYEYGGRTWYTDDGGVARLDDTMRSAAKDGLIVSAILLLNQAKGAAPDEFRRIVAHPDADPAGIFVMPNFTTAEGVAAYAAALNFLAERYSRPNGEYGRIHHWILHNEVNSGWVWTNMGDKSALRYMDAYHKSMRMAQLIAWQYDPYSKVYISLEHHWNTVYADHCHKGRELLEILRDFSQAEGDFPWGIAFHPYPENLRDPRVWEDETAWFSFDTPRITFKNMEVLDAWVKLPENRYRETEIRDVQFTEQGPNSPDYSEASLHDQAACMAYLWKKMEPLDSVTMFHFHNWVDNRHEGGLRIGLRRFPDDEEDPHGRKPVWYVFQALGTEREDEAIDFAKDVIGIKDWSEVIHTGPIPETKAN